ncbi:hypothetical protein [Paracoccus aestuariivivens]|uniref:Uncharacterized protein n=1 Tax=Paracoccus aestuariivivens TaxID=1820333 RepID=A0A6L6JH71_9RHOB|nr:hypothetical protein [Paracoccus aestuariivivens]MTH80059.1 hypothetical protein [Paracoccus aestuariivivens]
MTRPFRRRVLYIPGYDPIPPRRYRELYKREGVEQARISGYQLEFGARKDRTGFGWGVQGDFAGERTECEIEVLVWADIVQGSMGHSIAATYSQMVRTAWAYIGSGALFRLMRLRRGPVLAALYPVVVLILQLLSSLLIGGLIGWFIGYSTGLGWWLGVPVALALSYLGLKLWQRADGKIFVHYLMHDYAFTAQNKGAYPPALEQRIKEFSDRIATCLSDDWDEILIVGHSSGAYLGVSVLADLVRSGRVPGSGPRLSYLSLGHVIPMASFLPDANCLRADLRYLCARDELDWIDVSAPGDACSFGLCDPVSVSGVEPDDRRHPLIVSAAFRQTLSAEKQKALRGHWFKLHFQYLCAFDLPRDYDYFAITAGPVALGRRFAERRHSPGRIARAVNGWTTT